MKIGRKESMNTWFLPREPCTQGGGRRSRRWAQNIGLFLILPPKCSLLLSSPLGSSRGIVVVASRVPQCDLKMQTGASWVVRVLREPPGLGLGHEPVALSHHHDSKRRSRRWKITFWGVQRWAVQTKVQGTGGARKGVQRRGVLGKAVPATGVRDMSRVSRIGPLLIRTCSGLQWLPHLANAVRSRFGQSRFGQSGTQTHTLTRIFKTLSQTRN